MINDHIKILYILNFDLILLNWGQLFNIAKNSVICENFVNTNGNFLYEKLREITTNFSNKSKITSKYGKFLFYILLNSLKSG